MGLLASLLFVGDFKNTSFYGTALVFLLSSLLVGGVKGVLVSRVKKIIAYSSVANTGFLLIGVLLSTTAALWFGAQYAINTAGTLALLATCALGEGTGDLAELTSLQGFGSSNLGGILSLALLLFSTAGIPPTLGFFSKAGLFILSFAQDFILSLVVACIASVTSILLYLRLISQIFFIPTATASYSQALA